MPPVIVQFGGQTAINLAEPLTERGVHDPRQLAGRDRPGRGPRALRGVPARLGIPQPPGAAVTSLARRRGGRRPDRLSGAGAAVLRARRPGDGGRLQRRPTGPLHPQRRPTLTPDHPVLVDKYLLGKEVEVDAICDGETVLIPGIMEHIERAGVHSGDSFAVYPGINLYPGRDRDASSTTRPGSRWRSARAGLINIQYVIHGGRLYVLEVNPRSSRTVPFLSKVTGVPMVKLATNIMLGRSLREQGYAGGLWPRQPLVAVKAPVFSMAKLRGVEVNLGPEMKSTGEVMGIDRTFEPAFYKALIAAGLALPPNGSILITLADEDKAESLQMIGQLVRLGYKLYATEGTAALIERAGMPVQMVTKRIGRGKPDVLDVILERHRRRRHQHARPGRQGDPRRPRDPPGGGRARHPLHHLDRHRAGDGFGDEEGDLRLQRAAAAVVSSQGLRLLASGFCQ